MTKVFDIRKIRLRNDYMMLVDFLDKSQFVHVIDIVGIVPDYYHFKFTCKGIGKLDAYHSPIWSEHHEVEIFLHAEYPLKLPQMRWRTPIFHPNVHTTGSVCMGWWPAKTLDELVHTLAEIIQYKYFDVHNPMNVDAAKWALENRNKIPVDRRPIKIGKLATSEVKKVPVPRPHASDANLADNETAEKETNDTNPDVIVRTFDVLRSRFNLEELRTLCFYLKVNFDDLPGDGLSAKARELILFQQRRDKFGRLLVEICRTRPDITL